MLPEGLADEPTIKSIEARFPGAIVQASNALGELSAVVDGSTIASIGLLLKNELGFDRLSSVTAVDWWPVTPRFEVAYHLHGTSTGRRLRLKVRLAEGEELESVTPIWKTANWYEREVFDLFGIGFCNHPNLERIMMPADWEGHPLRKDYPVHGYKYLYSEDA